MSRPDVRRLYIPSPGQADARARASALEADLGGENLPSKPTWSGWIPSVPALVLDHWGRGPTYGQMMVLVEPIAPADVMLAEEMLVEMGIPDSVARTADLTDGGSRFPQAISLGHYLVLNNVGATYDGITWSKGLGMALVDFTGATSVDLRVFVSKVGSGTQSWQLWNVTDASQIAVIDDAGAAGDKVLSTTAAVALTGDKLIRLRAKSTTGADDPVFYGATVQVR